MVWNWQLPNWPHFRYDYKQIAALEKKFLMGAGRAFAYLKTVGESEYKSFVVEILSLEGIESSKIEGEILDRKSLQSSIKKHLGIEKKTPSTNDKEARMAELLYEVYETFDQPLTHKMLWQWHALLFKGSKSIDDCGKYRSHPEPMQIVSNRYASSKVFFEAPPSRLVSKEMSRFIDWFNHPKPEESIVARAAIAHTFFESIHPFEDGNGRIGRLLVEKALSQAVGQPVLIAISKLLEKQKKKYYSELERCNRTLDVQQWVAFFVQMIMQAHEESMKLLFFLIQKSKILNSLSGELNERQTKVLLRMFQEGPSGFKGGLSAENYITITKTSRATATRDLNDLVERNALIKTGELRYSRYQINLNYSEFFKRK